MRISEAFCKMRLSEYCTSQDIDRAIAVTVDSFVGSQKVSCKKSLARAFAKYVAPFLFFPFPVPSLALLSNFKQYSGRTEDYVDGPFTDTPSRGQAKRSRDRVDRMDIGVRRGLERGW